MKNKFLFWPLKEKKLNICKLSNEEITKLLEKEIKEFFPKTGSWNYSCFKKPMELDMNNLPCHLDNDFWIAKLFQKEKELSNININTIMEFLTNSGLYQNLKHDYALRIVEWQINWMCSGNNNIPSNQVYGGLNWQIEANCDIFFRKNILNTLLNIGLDEEIIEEGLEKYASIWREKYMNLAFINNIGIDLYFNNDNSIQEMVDGYKKLWMTMRNYDYYQNHKESVNKYGTVIPSMIIKENDIDRMKNYTMHVRLRLDEIKLRLQEETRIRRKIKEN